MVVRYNNITQTSIESDSKVYILYSILAIPQALLSHFCDRFLGWNSFEGNHGQEGA